MTGGAYQSCNIYSLVTYKINTSIKWCVYKEKFSQLKKGNIFQKISKKITYTELPLTMMVSNKTKPTNKYYYVNQVDVKIII